MSARNVIDELARRDYERRTDTLLRDILRAETPAGREPLSSMILRSRDASRRKLKARPVE